MLSKSVSDQSANAAIYSDAHTIVRSKAHYLHNEHHYKDTRRADRSGCKRIQSTVRNL